MFVYCGNCDYSTDDFDSVEELKNRVKADGGSLNMGLDTGTNICPECEAENTLHVD